MKTETRARLLISVVVSTESLCRHFPETSFPTLTALPVVGCLDSHLRVRDLRIPVVVHNFRKLKPLDRIAWARITRLSLPCPLAFPITNIVTTLAGPALIVFFAQTAVSKKKISAVLVSYLRYFLTLLPFTLLILALVYTIQSDMLSCSMESRWMHLFRAKDENSIRTIQSGLRCCGFNSLHDRAWPFPGRDVDSRACEVTFGYTRRCADVWQSQESTAAGLIALAGFLNWILLVIDAGRLILDRTYTDITISVAYCRNARSTRPPRTAHSECWAPSGRADEAARGQTNGRT